MMITDTETAAKSMIFVFRDFKTCKFIKISVSKILSESNIFSTTYGKDKVFTENLGKYYFCISTYEKQGKS